MFLQNPDRPTYDDIDICDPQKSIFYRYLRITKTVHFIDTSIMIFGATEIQSRIVFHKTVDRSHSFQVSYLRVRVFTQRGTNRSRRSPRRARRVRPAPRQSVRRFCGDRSAAALISNVPEIIYTIF